MALNTALEELRAKRYCCPPILSFFNWWSIWQFWGQNLEPGIINSQALILFQLQILPPIPPPLISEAQTLFGLLTFCPSVEAVPPHLCRLVAVQVAFQTQSYIQFLQTTQPLKITHLFREKTKQTEKNPKKFSSRRSGLSKWLVVCMT